jgi:hypothetical protein
MVDRGRQVTKESLEWSRIICIEGCHAQSFELVSGALQALGIPAGDDHSGPLSACSSCRLQPNASAAADYNDGLPEEFPFAPDENSGCCCAHDPSGNPRSGILTSLRGRSLW